MNPFSHPSHSTSELNLDSLNWDSLSHSLRQSNPENSALRSGELAESMLEQNSAKKADAGSLASVLHALVEAANKGIPELQVQIRQEQLINPHLVAVVVFGVTKLRSEMSDPSRSDEMGMMAVDSSHVIVEPTLTDKEQALSELSDFGRRLYRFKLTPDVAAFLISPEVLRHNLQELGKILTDDINELDDPRVDPQQRNRAILTIVKILDECDKSDPYFPRIRYNVEKLRDYFTTRVESGTVRSAEIDPCIKALEELKRSCVLVGFSFEDCVTPLERAKIVDGFYYHYVNSTSTSWRIQVFPDHNFTTSD